MSCVNNTIEAFKLGNGAANVKRGGVEILSDFNYFSFVPATMGLV